jgi:hypothetical protein
MDERTLIWTVKQLALVSFHSLLLLSPLFLPQQRRQKIKPNRDVIVSLLFTYFQQTVVMWPYTLALRGYGVQEFLKTTMPGVLLLRSIVSWEEGHSGLMVSVPDCTSTSLGLNQWLGSLPCVLGQDTLLSYYLSPSRCTNGYWVNLILWYLYFSPLQWNKYH